MRKVVNINIPKPCHEDWNKMTPDEKGRHCKVCQKSVFDFTSKTDEYIAKTFKENTNICGRFKSTQLKRDLVFSRKDKNNYISFLASGLFAFLGLSSQSGFSQGEPSIVKVDTLLNHTKIGKINSQEGKNSINGIVMDAYNTPLPGANVIIKNTIKGVVTNFDGEFSIEVKLGEILQISYVGFKSKEIEIIRDLKKVILLELEEDILGDMIVTVDGAISSTIIYELSSEEELERKKKLEFARQNGNTFYKRKRLEHKQKIKKK